MEMWVGGDPGRGTSQCPVTKDRPEEQTEGPGSTAEWMEGEQWECGQSSGRLEWEQGTGKRPGCGIWLDLVDHLKVFCFHSE